jgi:hypothetical protein
LPFPEDENSVLSEGNVDKLPAGPSLFVQDVAKNIGLAVGNVLEIALAPLGAENDQLVQVFVAVTGNFIFKLSHFFYLLAKREVKNPLYL